jgi:AcrR family transcriptional regulator
MRATYRALCECGYANLTMQDIADETELSKAALHYHYDTKQDLLSAFLEYLLDRHADSVADLENDPPAERLETFVDWLLSDPESEDARLYTALLELRAQAPYVEAYREQLRHNEAVVRGFVADALREGVEEGTFRRVDPEPTARLLLAAIRGARQNAVTLDDDDEFDAVGAALDEHVLSALLEGEE